MRNSASSLLSVYLNHTIGETGTDNQSYIILHDSLYRVSRRSKSVYTFKLGSAQCFIGIICTELIRLLILSTIVRFIKLIFISHFVFNEYIFDKT